MKINKVFPILISAISINAMAGPGTGPFIIETVHVERGHVYIKPESGLQDPLNCGINTMIKLNKDDPGFTEMYSMALTAFASGSTVQFWLQSCDGAPWAGDIAKAYAGQIVK